MQTFDALSRSPASPLSPGSLNPHAGNVEGDDPWWAIAASTPSVASNTVISPKSDARSDNDEDDGREETFVPMAPSSLEEAGLSSNEVEALILKFLLNRGCASGTAITRQIALPFSLIEGLLRRLKSELLVVYKAAGLLNDYVYELTDVGVERARRYSAQCTYFGAAPVNLDDYAESVRRQSLVPQKPNRDDMKRAFADLVVNADVFDQVGQALHAGRGMFLYGASGNGKSSIAERVTAAFNEAIWIPRTLSVLGQIVRLFDPAHHEPLSSGDESFVDENRIDRRWVRVRRPTIVVGGELTISKLEINFNPATGISEAPLHLKSNGGTFVVDDFGRQRVTPAELLNRWIVPLEKRFDYLNLASGRTVQVPFDQIVIFSTNLDSHGLVDEAFFRRIPYKINVFDPTEAEFREVFDRRAKEMSIECPAEAVDYLMNTHYKASGRQLRFCHPRDLLLQIENFCGYHERPRIATHDAIDAAVKNYFVTD